MGILDFIILGGLLLWLAAVLVFLKKKKKNGGCIGCTGCPGTGSGMCAGCRANDFVESAARTKNNRSVLSEE